MKIKKNYLLKRFTTMAIGGPAKFFIVAKTEQDLARAVEFANRRKLPWYVVGEGSNLIAADKGYGGVMIQNKIEKLDFHPSPALPIKGREIKANSSPLVGEARWGGFITVGAGNNLLQMINKFNRLGLSGIERMAGIPGTVGGAIYGCAGAYGQEIKDNLVSVRFFDGKGFRALTLAQCKFGYRTSIFKKHKNWIITEVRFKLKPGKSADLGQISRDTIKLRAVKYKPGLKCPGSFFKNLKADEIRVPEALKDKIVYGKLPAGVLLEEVGAKGMRQGGIRVAVHHANLIYNPNGGKASEVKKLSTRLKALVKKKFGIIIDEEVQHLE